MTVPNQIEIIRRHVTDALERGATALVGGLDSIQPPYVHPIVLVDVPGGVVRGAGGDVRPGRRHQHRRRTRTRRSAGRTRPPFGLGSSVFSASRTAPEIAARLRAGGTTINSVLTFVGHAVACRSAAWATAGSAASTATTGCASSPGPRRPPASGSTWARTCSAFPRTKDRLRRRPQGAEAALRPEVPLMRSADYVVVGAGSAGAILARRLADTRRLGDPARGRPAGQHAARPQARDDRPDARGPAAEGEGRLGALHGRAEARPGPQDPADARQGRRRVELDQRHGVRPRQPQELRRLGRRGQHRLELRRRAAELQEVRELRGRRQRLPRRQRPDQGHPCPRAHPRVGVLHRRAERDRRRQEERGLQRGRARGRVDLPAEQLGRAALQHRRSATWTTARRTSPCCPRRRSPGRRRGRPGDRRRDPHQDRPRGRSAPSARSCSAPASTARRTC